MTLTKEMIAIATKTFEAYPGPCTTEEAIEAALTAALSVSRDEEREQSYRAMLRAIMLRQGGSLRIEPEEMPEDAYSIVWCFTPEGGLEAMLEDGKTRQ